MSNKEVKDKFDLIHDIYAPILKMAGMAVTTDNCVSLIDGDKTKPLTLKGKRWVLPTREQLTKVDFVANCVAFHPAMENYHRGESEVLGRYRNLAMVHFNSVFGAILRCLLEISTSPALQTDLSPDQTEFLTSTKAANEETIKRLMKMIESTPSAESGRIFMKLYMKRGASIDGRDFGRAGIVTFPMYEELKAKGAKKVFGVDLRKGDIEALTGLMEYMIPNIGKPDAHSRGSNTQIAPIFDAMMRTLDNLAFMLNDLSELFANKFGSGLLLDRSWSPGFDLDKLYSQIQMMPMLPGNEGATSALASDVKPSVTTPGVAVVGQVVAPAPFAPAVVHSNPHTTQAPAMTAPKTTGSLYDQLTGRQPVAVTAAPPMQPAMPPPPPPPAPAPWVPPAQPQYQAYPTQQPYNPYAQLQQPQHMQPRPAIMNPNGTANFAAMLASDPAMAAAAGMNAWGQPQYNQQPNNGRASLSSPAAAQPQGWGQPQQQGWGQPQMNAWGQPQQQPQGYQPSL
jgi:hypothetical protein